MVCQLGTGEPELALKAAKHVVRDVAAIDVNMGCPMKFSVSGGMGSALLKDPDRAARILKMLKNDLLQPLNKPLSCKIRLLENTQKTVDFIEGMIRAGADAVAIHARRPGHDQTVSADWKSLEEVLGLLRPKYPDINFLVNGDFYDRKERSEFIERTKVDGVLLGRPALYNTSTFLPLTTHTTLVDKTTVVQEYLRKSVRYDVHYKNAKYVICEMMSHRRTPTGRVPYLSMGFPQGQTIAKTCNCQDLASTCQVWNVNYSEALASITTNNITNNHSSTSTSTPTGTTALAAGEHRYEDSYFLKRERVNNEVEAEEKKSDEKVVAQPQNNKGDDTINNNDQNNNNNNVVDDGDAQKQTSKRAKTILPGANQSSI